MPLRPSRAAQHLDAVLHARDQRLLDQDVQVLGQRVAHHVDVREVGRGDHHRVAQSAGQQLAVVLEDLRRVVGTAPAPPSRLARAVSASAVTRHRPCA
jgi:hypothetical protein